LCLAVVLAAMGWMSAAVLRLDEAEARARRQATLEENVRLALWRMDSAVAPLLAQESARPYFTYRTFLPVDRAYGQMFRRDARGEKVLPSPLLGDVSPYVRLHFQFDPDGRLTSPRAVGDGNSRLVVPRYLSAETVREAQRQLSRVAGLTDRARLASRLPWSAPATAEAVFATAELNPANQLAQSPQRNESASRNRGVAEFQQRNRSVLQNTNAMVQSQVLNTPLEAPWSATDVGGVMMTPLWLGDELVLARRVAAGGQEYVQGCLMDWPAIKRWLRETVEDLLPEADLQPTRDGAPDGEARLLAALPVQLVVGPPTADGDPPSPIRLTLLLAWGCALAAAGAVSILLAGVVRLSQRRSAFVSAVTHELRTPLTTFHMYTEMLADGMVPEPDRQHEYLTTLRTEASRLSHLVENVLAYARLERGRTSGRVESIAVERLIGLMRDRLADRAAQAGMGLVVDVQPAAQGATVRVSASAVEQILFNLVDNACKYSANAADKRIHLEVELRGSVVRIRVRDHGPGIARPASRRLFRPFGKSAREAANSAPGIGLGLALSRRLARDMGARLRVEKTDGGAGLCLSVPVVGEGHR
jgi:signal transduction histidine kinase